MQGLADLLAELRRRGVFGTTAIYIVAAWVLVQVVSEILPAFNIPEFAIRYVWIGVVLGFPLALLAGWRYDISTGGIRRTATRGAGLESGTALQRSDYVLFGAVGLLVAGLAAVLITQIAGQALPPGDLPGRELAPDSVAILPLDNFTGDEAQDYFVAGLHEALTAGLTGIRALRVISRTSATALAGSGKTVPEIGQALGARNIIEGSVFRSGDRIRVTVQLIDALTDQHLWAENFERDLTDLLTLQSELTRAIAQQIEVTLTPEEDQRLSKERPVDPEVYQRYLKGMYFLKQYTPDSIAKGLPYLHEAVELDPSNARAYAGLALGYNTIGHHFGEDAFPRAMAAAQRALELDAFSGEAWAALAEAQVYHDYAFETADRSYRRALELAPSLDEAHAHYSYLLVLFDDWDAAFSHSHRARELNPLDPTWAFFTGWLYLARADYVEAEAHFQEALEIHQNFPLGLWGLGELYMRQGRLDEGITVLEGIPPGVPVRNWALGPAYATVGRDDDARRVIAEMTAAPGPKEKLFIALAYATLGDFDQAMDWLESCYETRVDWLPWIVIHDGYGHGFEDLRDNSRFQALIDRFGLPEPAAG